MKGDGKGNRQRRTRVKAISTGLRKQRVELEAMR